MLTYPYVPPPPPLRGMWTAENSVADSRAAAVVEIRARVRKRRRRGTRARAGVCNCRYLILSRRRRRSGAGGRRTRRRRRPASLRTRTAPTPLTPSYLLATAAAAVAAVRFFSAYFCRLNSAAQPRLTPGCRPHTPPRECVTDSTARAHTSYAREKVVVPRKSRKAPPDRHFHVICSKSLPSKTLLRNRSEPAACHLQSSAVSPPSLGIYSVYTARTVTATRVYIYI